MFNCSGPVVLRIQCDLGAVAQRDLQFGRTLTILVFAVVPDLLDGRFGLFCVVAVG